MNIKASFLSVEDEPPDLILSFAQNDMYSGCKSLILMRTKKYEVFKFENERGVGISWEDDDDDDYFDEIITSFEWNKSKAIITSPKRTIEVDISKVGDDELKEMEQILFKMNDDNCFKLKKI
jgi:hypothetical protein